MKAQELLEVVIKNKTVDLRSLLEIKKYIPISLKKSVIEEVLLESTLSLKENMLTYNGIQKYLTFVLTVLNLYTNLEIENIETDYDLLMEKELLPTILETIGNDYFEFKDLYDMRFEDKLRETNTLEAIINSGFQDLLFSLTGTLERVNKAIDNIDENTVRQLINKLDKLQRR